ncbi:unnamed protein product [Cuscuta epithymum]|uniref:RNase H type-1 domain-containing protein n=1 Tax=Cuscuta epithymum TaxID=186058 RepID=A0AAV0DDG1_9ASTE|nr:unnamed protein product [Cuscuta epithymum]
MLKLNIDAAVRVNGCRLGWCLRDDRGNFVATATRSWPGKLSPLGAEMIGIREALSWVKERGWTHIEVETDSFRAITEILHGSSCSSIGLVSNDIKDLAKKFSISICHVLRSANKIAHAIARVACSLFDLCSCIYYPPFIVSVLANDLLNDKFPSCKKQKQKT